MGFRFSSLKTQPLFKFIDLGDRLITRSAGNPGELPNKIHVIDFAGGNESTNPTIEPVLDDANDRSWPKALVPRNTMNVCYREIAQ